MSNKLTIALPKGRMVKNAADVFTELGFGSDELNEEVSGRIGAGKSIDKLDNNLYKGERADFIIPKAYDVAGYVDQGVADMGILGDDCKEEYTSGNPERGRGFISGNVNNRFIFPKMRFCLIGQEARKQEFLDKVAEQKRVIVATSYPGQAADYFARAYPDYNTRFWDMMPLEGEVELAVRTGRADIGFEMVSSGASLQKNQLAIYKEAYEILVKLLANQASLRNNPVVARLARMIQSGKTEPEPAPSCVQVQGIH